MIELLKKTTCHFALITIVLMCLLNCVNNNSKVISGSVVERNTNVPLSHIRVEIIEYETQLFQGNEIGIAGETMTDTNGNFKFEFTPDKNADAWLLDFISEEQNANVSKYNDIAWYKNNNAKYELTAQY